MTYPLVLDLAANHITVAASAGCRFCTQAFYAWKKRPVRHRDLVDAYATNAACEVHADGTSASGTASSQTSSPTPATLSPNGGCGGSAHRPGSSRPTPHARPVEEPRPAGPRHLVKRDFSA